MKRLFHLLLLACLLPIALVAAGCAAAPQPRAEAAYDMAPGVASRQMAKPVSAPMPEVPALEAIKTERKIILTANLQLVVRETEKTVATIKDMVVARGGYVSTANLWHVDNLLRANLTVRVPVAQVEAFLTEVRGLAVRVEREESGGHDVTEEYVDLQAQLKNLEAAEVELRELLTTVRERTGKAEDVMAVYRELMNVRGQIDRLQGRRQYLDRMTELATVNLELHERQAEPIGRPGWQPGHTLRRALGALVQTARFGVDVLIWLAVYVTPILVVPVLAIWLLVFLLRRRSNKARQLSKPESLQ